MREQRGDLLLGTARGVLVEVGGAGDVHAAAPGS